MSEANRWCHWRPHRMHRSACGILGEGLSYAEHSPSYVDCPECRATDLWKAACVREALTDDPVQQVKDRLHDAVGSSLGLVPPSKDKLVAAVRDSVSGMLASIGINDPEAVVVLESTVKADTIIVQLRLPVLDQTVEFQAVALVKP